MPIQWSLIIPKSTCFLFLFCLSSSAEIRFYARLRELHPLHRSVGQCKEMQVDELFQWNVFTTCVAPPNNIFMEFIVVFYFAKLRESIDVLGTVFTVHDDNNYRNVNKCSAYYREKSTSRTKSIRMKLHRFATPSRTSYQNIAHSIKSIDDKRNSELYSWRKRSVPDHQSQDHISHRNQRSNGQSQFECYEFNSNGNITFRLFETFFIHYL